MWNRRIEELRTSIEVKRNVHAHAHKNTHTHTEKERDWEMYIYIYIYIYIYFALNGTVIWCIQQLVHVRERMGTIHYNIYY